MALDALLAFGKKIVACIVDNVDSVPPQVIPPIGAEGLDRRGARGVLSAVSWPWVPACGSLEPPRRDGENAQKDEKKRGENGRDMI